MWIIENVKCVWNKLFTKLSTVYTEVLGLLQKSYKGIHKNYKIITTKLQICKQNYQKITKINIL